MSAAIDALKLAWRDYLTDGMPGSGENEPAKAEIRAGLDQLDSLIASVSSGIQRYATVGDLPGDAADGTLALVEGDTYYEFDGTDWVVATWYVDLLKGETGADGLMAASNAEENAAGAINNKAVTPLGLNELGVLGAIKTTESLQKDIYDTESDPVTVWDSQTVASQVTGPSTTPIVGVFSGFAQLMNAGVGPFNVVQVPFLRRPADTANEQKWVKAIAIVRASATDPHLTTAPIVGLGIVNLDPEVAAYDDLDIYIRGTTGAGAFTECDPDTIFTVGVYVLNASNSFAEMNRPNGTMDGKGADSYYLAQGATGPDARTSPWAAYTGDPAMGYRLLYRTGLRDTYPLSDSFRDNVLTDLPKNEAELTQFVEDLIAGETPTYELIVPPVFYLRPGFENTIYFDNLITLPDWREFAWDVSVSASEKGRQIAEGWRITPTGAITSGDITITMMSKDGATVLASATVPLRCAAADAGTGLTLDTLWIGDSLVGAGVLTQTALDIAAADALDITLHGTRGSGANVHEGRGGWSIINYTTAGPTYYAFTVSGVDEAPAINATRYEVGGSIYLAQEVDLDLDGDGTITFSVISGGAPPANGTLTKTTATAGDATIAFSASAAVPGNPFWIGGALNFDQYLTNESMPAMDAVHILLGTNDAYGQSGSAATVYATMQARAATLETLVTNILASDAGTKVMVMPPPPGAFSQDAFGANYQDGETRDNFKRNVMLLAKALIARFGGRIGERILVSSSYAAIDTVNNYPKAAPAPVNARNPAVTVARADNGVHPDTPGCQQMEDAEWGLTKWLVTP